MKKLILVLLLAVVTSGSAWAQKGMMGVGGNLAMTVGFDDGGIGIGGAVKFQYNISDYFRIEPSVTYYAPLDEKNGTFDLAALANIHIFILSPRSVRPYVFAGVGYLGYKKDKENYWAVYNDTYDSQGNWTGYTTKEYSSIEHKTDNGFGIDGGLGLDCRLSHSLSLQVEAGVLWGFADDDCFGAKANIGLCYNF